MDTLLLTHWMSSSGEPRLQQYFNDTKSIKLYTNITYHTKKQTLSSLYITMLKARTHTGKKAGKSAAPINKEIPVETDIQLHPSPHSVGKNLICCLLCKLSRQEDFISYLPHLNPIRNHISFSLFIGQKNTELCTQTIAFLSPGGWAPGFNPWNCLHIFSAENQGGLAHQLGKPLIKQAS